MRVNTKKKKKKKISKCAVIFTYLLDTITSKINVTPKVFTRPFRGYTRF